MNNYDLYLATPPKGYAATDAEQQFFKDCERFLLKAIALEEQFCDELSTSETEALNSRARSLLVEALDFEASNDFELDEAWSELALAISVLKNILG